MAELVKPAPGATIRQSEAILFSIISDSNTTPPSVQIPAIDEVYMKWTDKDGKTHESLRTIRFSRGESSIFADEQSPMAQKNIGEIIFFNGARLVSRSEATLLKYLNYCSYNKKNAEFKLPGKPTLFEENQAGRVSREFLDKEQKKSKLKSFVFEMPDDEAYGLGMSFGINLPKNEDNLARLKQQFIAMIDYDAQKFEAEIESDLRKRKLVLLKAVEYKFISVDKTTNSIFNEIGTKTRILDCKSYVDALEYFAQISLDRDQYKEAFNDIEAQVLMKEKSSAPNPESDAAKLLLEECLEHNIIVKNFGNYDAANTAVGRIGKNESAAIKKILSDQTLRKKLEGFLAEAKSGK